MSFDLAFAREIAPSILAASWVTFYISLASGGLAVVAGFLLALGQRGPRAMALASNGLVNTVRLSPFLVQLYFLYYVLPIWGVTIPALWVGILALALNSACFLAGVFGAGLDAIPNGQQEAARSLGLRPWQVAVLVLVPQMIRVVIGPTANYMITLFKTTPYLAIIGVPEMLGVAFDHASDSFRYVEPLSVAGALFLTYCLMISAAVRWLELRLRRVHAR